MARMDLCAIQCKYRYPAANYVESTGNSIYIAYKTKLYSCNREIIYLYHAAEGEQCAQAQQFFF